IAGAVTINSGATLAPGPTNSSVGTLTISNNLTIAGNVAIAVNKSLSPSHGGFGRRSDLEQQSCGGWLHFRRHSAHPGHRQLFIQRRQAGPGGNEWLP